MPLIQLRHHRKLRYPSTSRIGLPVLPEHVLALARERTVVTFRPLPYGRPDRVVKDVHACRRFSDLPQGDVVFFGIESDSPLAPLIFWDAAHHLPVGGTITVLGEMKSESYLEQAYYRGCLVVEAKAEGQTVLRKVQRLPAEADAGLDRWTFGIPVGPDDATLLNVVVKRILELDVPQKEIVLCGRPGANFQYFDQVRIVGEDITAPPVRICAKKNRIAQEARYENLCIIHDRVFLPLDFYDAVKRFGDHYPLVAFQSLYFDDKFNMVPRRYSDYNTAPKVRAQATRGLMRDNDARQPSPFSPAVLALTETSGFYYANPLRHSRANYPTGSLYLAKRSVWLACPQNEQLYWTEFEDLDQGFRADDLGIPSRVNPYAVTQSLISRPLLSLAGAIHYETLGGMSRLYRAPLEAFPLPRKPLVKVTRAHASAQLGRFSEKYTPRELHATTPSNAVLTTRARTSALVQAVQRVRIPIQRKAVQQLLTDYERQLAFDQALYNWREWAELQFLAHGSAALINLVRDNQQLVNQASQRPRGDVFAESLRDYLPRRGVGVILGSLCTALLLGLKNRQVLYFPGGLLFRMRALLRSTPFADYAEA